MSLSSPDVRSGLSARISGSTSIGRREIFLWVGGALLANEVLHLLDFQSLSSFVVSFECQNLILWLAGYAFVYRVFSSDPDRPADRLDYGFSAAMCLSMLVTGFLSHSWSIGLIATAIAVYLWLTHRGDRNLRAAGCLLLALTGYLVWGPIFFRLLTPEVVRVDAAIVGGMLELLRPDIIWNDTVFRAPRGHAILLVGGCSSFQNISTAILACVTFTMLSRTRWVRRDLVTIAVATGAMVLSNAARLCLLAWDSTAFNFWHDGDGKNLFVFGQTALVLLIASAGAATSRHEA